MQNAPEAGAAGSDPAPGQPSPPVSPSEPLAGPSGAAASRPKEIGGPEGPEPTRFGDWEKKGRCIDF